MIYRVLHRLLSEDGQLQELVGGRIYPFPAPQEYSKPFVVFEPQSMEHEESLSGHSGLSKATVLIHSCAADPGGLVRAWTISTAVRLAVQGRNGELVEGIIVGGIQTPDESFDFALPENESEYGIHIVSLTALISWRTDKRFRLEPVEAVT